MENRAEEAAALASTRGNLQIPRNSGGRKGCGERLMEGNKQKS